ncbi:hypothetical protein CEXT_486551 [Caerostris extrusa]|uniref:Uncharacterized protein n=1 Tax=Caerostris extrusa TaxID=172846 RepID=A0AAV4SUS6_CAEEX|nr:hypothetical protein CEXT_486551 [Caerostris extrusa]
MSTCKLTIGDMDDSIRLDGKGTTRSPPFIPREFSVATGLKFFILEQISEKAKRVIWYWHIRGAFWGQKISNFIVIEFNMRRDPLKVDFVLLRKGLELKQWFYR